MPQNRIWIAILFVWVFTTFTAEAETALPPLSGQSVSPDLRAAGEITLATTGTVSNYSGIWFDPELDGEGYLIFQTDAGWLVYYFGYSNEREKLWLVSDIVELEELVKGEPFELEMHVGIGGTFSNPLNPELLENYGSLWISFTDCDSGIFTLDGLDGEKTSEVMKLAGVEGTECVSHGELRNIPQSLSSPAAGYSKLVPVVLVSHIPTNDGVVLDLEEANYDLRPAEWQNNSVSDLLDYIEKISIRTKFALESMSRFRGYKKSTSSPYLGYKVLAHYVFYDPLPLHSRTNPYNSSQQMVDFKSLMEKINGEEWVEKRGVQEFWFNNYFNEKFQFWESNMSSPSSVDISNSDQFTGDLPIYSKTYVVYGTNYHRTQAEAIHNHGHQIERMLDFIDRRASGTSDLFWGAFVGVPDFPGPAMIPGRCGWTHQPPNTNMDYGYADPTTVEVDCEDWRPDGSGQKRAVNSLYFLDLNYQWPGGDQTLPQLAESNFYIWWGQNMPGLDNSIPYRSTIMENWWKIIGDWDTTIKDNINLYR